MEYVGPPVAEGASRRRPDLRPFLLWLALFYGSWAALLWLRELGPAALAHWPIAAAMLAGSYVAGSTPMGGGTVGFPVLVLLFHQPATLGRDFSFAIQSIGMTSASIYILCSGRPVAWPMLGAALLGSALGTPLGILAFAPHVTSSAIKVLFAVVWASFGILTLVRLRDVAGAHGIVPGYRRLDRLLGVAIGAFGGALVASVTGVGIDMLIYSVLVLVRRTDLKVAIPTSVVLMSFTSLVGLGTKLATGGLEPGVFEQWIAAAPVVALGAPLGAFVVDRIGRVPTLAFVSVLCILQFVWTYYEGWSDLGGGGLALGLTGLLAFQAVFHALYVLGRTLAGEK
jgi:uncharacterized membrane protein YfcA